VSEGPLVPAAGPTAPTAPLAVPTGPTAPTGRLARLWARPLVAHVAMLALVLGLGLFLIGPRVGYSSDEGAALSQARLLVRDHTWLYRYPLAGIDPQDQARPFIRGDRGTKGVAPYAKHPLYPAVLAGADWVAGPAGWWVLTLIGTVGAAAMAALLARRLDPRLTRATLWVVGVGSPLLFDAYFVLAHSLAAFAAGAGPRNSASVRNMADQARNTPAAAHQAIRRSHGRSGSMPTSRASAPAPAAKAARLWARTK